METPGIRETLERDSNLPVSKASCHLASCHAELRRCGHGYGYENCLIPFCPSMVSVSQRATSSSETYPTGTQIPPDLTATAHGATGLGLRHAEIIGISLGNPRCVSAWMLEVLCVADTSCTPLVQGEQELLIITGYKDTAQEENTPSYGGFHSPTRSTGPIREILAI